MWTPRGSVAATLVGMGTSTLIAIIGLLVTEAAVLVGICLLLTKYRD